MTLHRWASVIALLGATFASTLGAQAPSAPAAVDPAVRIRQALPADIADRVLATIEAARAQGLASEALEQRALKFSARGVAPGDIERSVAEQAQRQAQAKSLLEAARGTTPSTDEVEAGAEAMREGVDGRDVSGIAKSAPSGRSLSVPLYVLGSLTSHGLASSDALARVKERIAAGATDADLESLPGQAAGNAADAGTAPGQVKHEAGDHPDNANGTGVGNGPPPGVPRNGNGKAKGHGNAPGNPPNPPKPPHPGKP